jgi:hypothetical protein
VALDPNAALARAEPDGQWGAAQSPASPADDVRRWLYALEAGMGALDLHGNIAIHVAEPGASAAEASEREQRDEARCLHLDRCVESSSARPGDLACRAEVIRVRPSHFRMRARMPVGGQPEGDWMSAPGSLPCRSTRAARHTIDMKQLHSRLALLALVAFACGCQATRSISNPVRPWGGGNGTYQGELSDFDVVGVAAGSALTPDTKVVLRPHARVLLVQSGALFPGERLVSALSEHFEIGIASGMPTAGMGEHGLRDAAARGRFDAVVAYWGVLESSERDTAGKAASWVPIAGWFVPDSSQRMRIRLRIVVLDVSTGQWTTLLPKPIDDERASAIFGRESSDRDQVELLLSAAVPTVVEALTHGM